MSRFPGNRALANPQLLRAMLLMIGSMACFSVMNLFIRYASLDLHTTQIVFLRNLFSVLILLPWLWHAGIGALKTERLSGHFWRGSFGVIGMQLWFYCVATLPLNEATALSFTAPIFTFIFAILFLGEKAGWHRWLATLVGFAGAMVIIRPDPSNLNHDMLVVLLATSMWGIAGMLVKSLTRTEPPTRIVFYMAAVMLLWSTPAAIYYWQPADVRTLIHCAAIAIASTGAHLLMVRAYAKADIVLLLPFDFFRLVFTALLAYGAFGEVADCWTWAGGAIIVGSAAYIAYRESHRRHEQPLPDEKEPAI